MRSDRLTQHLAPIRLGQEGGADVGQEGQGEEEEDLLHPAVGAAGDQQPHEDGGGRHGDVAADPERLPPKGSAAAATPMNSDTMIPRLAISRVSRMRAVWRRVNVSRTRSENPLP